MKSIKMKKVTKSADGTITGFPKDFNEWSYLKKLNGNLFFAKLDF